MVEASGNLFMEPAAAGYGTVGNFRESVRKIRQLQAPGDLGGSQDGECRLESVQEGIYIFKQKDALPCVPTKI